MTKLNFRESLEWTDNEGYNLTFLRKMEEELNGRMRRRGYMYLNQIYEALGFRWDPDKENILFQSDRNGHPGCLELEYFPGGNGLLLIHDFKGES